MAKKVDLQKKLSDVFDRYHVSQHEDNYHVIEQYINANEVEKELHKSTEKDAHLSSQIKHITRHDQKTDVQSELNYLHEQNEHLILGNLGNGQQEVRGSRVSMDAIQHNTLDARLYHDFLREKNEREKGYEELKGKINRVVNVDEYGADPTGVKDSTEAFHKALGSGNVQVTMSAGTYKIYGIKLPSNTRLVGQGKDITILKVADDAENDVIAVTNANMSGNARNISIENFTVNGNRWRQGGNLSPAGGSLSSGVRFAGVKHGYIYNIKSYDNLLHGIDITYANDAYYYGGDGSRVSESLESKYIHVDNCETYGFGDDGITTHWSRYLLITNNYSHHPAKNGGNNNGIEADDGSQFVFLDNNRTEMCYAGVEIKAHATASAASNVYVGNHMSIKDCRSYNIRHIGHHRAGDPQSKTAYNVMLNNCTAIYPYANGVYPNATPRALCICAFRNVQINNFSAYGDSNYTANQPVVVVQFRAENVTLNGINIQGFAKASADLKIMGGGNKPKKITFANVNIYNSSEQSGIQGGSGVYDTKIIGANLIGRGSGNAIEMYNNTAEIIGVNAEGYTNKAMISKKAYNVVPTVLKGGLSAGSTGSGALAQRSAILASTGGSYAHNDRSWVAGSGGESQARGSRSAVLNSLQSETLSGSYCQTIVNSRGVKSSGNYQFLMGYGTDGAKYENVTIQMGSTSGNIKAKGTIQSGQNFGDYAEYFESQSGQPIPNGTIVTLDGRYIRKAQEGDIPLGVISGTAGVILGDQMFHHKDKFLKDEFGVTLTEWQTKEWQDDEGNWYSEEVETPIPNPDYVESEDDYIPRSQRPEWNVVGLIGQVFVRYRGDLQANDYIKADAGIGYRDNVNGYYRVQEITTPYDPKKGYGVAVCFIHPITKGGYK